MLLDNHIFKVVIVISPISIKNIRAVKKKTEKRSIFLFSRGMDLLEVFWGFFGEGGYFGLNLRQLRWLPTVFEI
jgi:hypothetical protein